MTVHRKEFEQLIPGTIQDVWEFFSNPGNLNKITPEDMSFKIESDVSDGKTFAGRLIVYTVSPFKWMSTRWVTEITACEDQKYFIDEQRFGPFKLWHHRHSFEEVENGVLMKDELHYVLPFGIFGKLFGGFVHKRVNGIFTHREKVIDGHFS